MNCFPNFPRRRRKIIMVIFYEFLIIFQDCRNKWFPLHFFKTHFYCMIRIIDRNKIGTYDHSQSEEENTVSYLCLQLFL